MKYRDRNRFVGNDKLERALRQFHKDNPNVYATLVTLAQIWKKAGHQHCGIGMLFERARYELYLRKHPDGLSLNNNHRRFYARLMMKQEPGLRSFFRIRGRVQRRKRRCHRSQHSARSLSGSGREEVPKTPTTLTFGAYCKQERNREGKLGAAASAVHTSSGRPYARAGYATWQHWWSATIPKELHSALDALWTEWAALTA